MLTQLDEAGTPLLESQESLPMTSVSISCKVVSVKRLPRSKSQAGPYSGPSRPVGKLQAGGPVRAAAAISVGGDGGWPRPWAPI